MAQREPRVGLARMTLLALCVIAGGMGVFSIVALDSAGRLIADAYDGALATASYARAAGNDFRDLQIALLERRNSPKQAHGTEARHIDDGTVVLLADLSAAEERAIHDDEVAAIVHVRALIARWDELRRKDPADPALVPLARSIGDGFAALIELDSDHGFLDRRDSLRSVTDFQLLAVAFTALALLIALFIAAKLARRETHRPSSV